MLVSGECRALTRVQRTRKRQGPSVRQAHAGWMPRGVGGAGSVQPALSTAWTRQRREHAATVVCCAPAHAAAVLAPAEASASSVAQNGIEGLRSSLMRVNVRRVLVWISFCGTCWLLRDFAGLGAGTFVLSFIGNSVIDTGVRWVGAGRRKAVTVAWFCLLLALVVGFGLLTIPRISSEGASLLVKLTSGNMIDLIGDKIKDVLGPQLTSSMDKFLSLFFLSQESISVGRSEELLSGLARGELPMPSGEVRMAIQNAVKEHLSTAVMAVVGTLSTLTRLTLQGVISLVFSFLILWDFSGVQRDVQRLNQTRLRPFMEELGPPLAAFGRLFGKALQAQCAIAGVNTALTALSMAVLQIPSIGFLSLVVFIGSFIPVAGVFISTFPIGFIALAEHGLFSLLGVIVSVMAIHAVEAYLLNPAIYSATLKLPPLVVLCALVLAEHYFGVIGLLFAVPTAVFAVSYLLPLEDAAKDKGGRSGAVTFATASTKQ